MGKVRFINGVEMFDAEEFFKHYKVKPHEEAKLEKSFDRPRRIPLPDRLVKKTGNRYVQ